MQPAAAGLERIIAQSLRQAPATDRPLLAWPVVCGSAVAERTRALTFSDGILQIAVADQGWKTELLSLAPRYVAMLNRYAPATVERIEFVVARESISAVSTAPLNRH